ncbi:MAG TPA: hypothetical protein VGJ33_20915 [Candidatus Angelobacter sp.]|jgi:hypothetical protein
MATTEHTINDALAQLLRGTRRAWRDTDMVGAEDTGQLKGSTARPDILVVEPNVSPVVIETEVFPATTVESEASGRLGAQLKTTGRKILSSIAVRLPDRLRKKHGNALSKDLESATDLEMALYTGSSPTAATRWPTSGWMTGTVADLSILTQSASVPPDVIDEASTSLVNGVSEAAGMLIEIAKGNKEAVHKISKELFQEDGVQTRRMAATILANAFVFHESLAGKLSGVNSIDELRGKKKFNKTAVLEEWHKILKVNYWPIFDIARRLLEHIPVAESKPLIERLADTADRLLENQLMRSHDLTGAVFQRMIVDRKFLAAYYTTPASAALLLGLAITPNHTPGNTDWTNPENITSLQIADFACGTGTLLTTAYQRIGQLHELAGGDSEAIHSKMMGHALIGCDVLPAAAHLTASMLSGAHPTITYDRSNILTVAYGKMAHGNIALGSIDLLDDQKNIEVLEVTAKAIGGMGEKEMETWSSLPHASFDLVVMNPPFVRPTGHEGEKIGVPVPMFAAFDSTEEEQRIMSKAMKRLTKGTSYHGNAGEASAFLVIAHRKLKEGGTLALVMPLSLMPGDAWEASREVLTNHYSGLIFASIAGRGSEEMSFSADTGMGECLVIGQKDKKGSTRATFVVLKERPSSTLLGSSIARQIRRLIRHEELRTLENGPTGGTPLTFGKVVVGQAMDAPLPLSGGFNLSRIADLSLGQAAYQMANGNIWLPAMDKTNIVKIPMTTVSAIGTVGPYHADIDGDSKKKDGTKTIRGPFNIIAVPPDTVPTYPVLWSHDAEREGTLMFEGDFQAQKKAAANQDELEAIDLKAAAICALASHCHFNQNFQFNSQPTAMQYTPRNTIGGRAWTSIQLSDDDHEKVLVAWGNSSLGLLVHWWISNKQQSGRGNITPNVLQNFPVLDVSALTLNQLQNGVKVFNEICHKKLLPIHQIAEDPTRKELDERFAIEVLGLPKSLIDSDGALELLRMKLAQEPSIRGNK